MTDATADWFWEGNVVATLSRALLDDGWQIISIADTHTKERGVDIHAEKGGTMLLIEAKGYPSVNYRDPRRAAEKKPTNPTNQAQKWYSHAMLKVMRLQTKHPDALVAVCLPDFLRYRTLFNETQTALAKLGAGVIFIGQDGRVEKWGMP